jgi:hypothetical protein
VSFWHATYCAVGPGIFAVAFLYWALWIVVIPKIQRYKLVEETMVLPDRSAYNHLSKVFYKDHFTECLAGVGYIRWYASCNLSYDARAVRRVCCANLIGVRLFSRV